MSCTCPVWRGPCVCPLQVDVPWLYDDGTETVDATLRGEVHPSGAVDFMTLVLDDGEEVDVPAALRGEAQDDLVMTAFDMWGAR